MRKQTKKMAPLCSAQGKDFRNLAGEHVFGVREDLRGKLDFFSAAPQFIVRRNQKNDPANYDFFGSGDTKNLFRVLGNVMKSGAQRHLFCLTTSFRLWCQAFLFKEMEKILVTRKIMARPGSESRQSGSVEL